MQINPPLPSFTILSKVSCSFIWASSGIFDNLFNKKQSEANNIEDSFDLENAISLEDSQSLIDIIVSTWQNLDVNIIAPYLSDDFQYNSVWVTATMNGKDDYLEFLRGKFENFKKTDNLPIVDVIDENGVDLPHFIQGEAEGVIDFQLKDGKIISNAKWKNSTT